MQMRKNVKQGQHLVSREFSCYTSAEIIMDLFGLETHELPDCLKWYFKFISSLIIRQKY